MSISNGLIWNEIVTQQHGIGQKICLKSTCIYFRFCIFSCERHFNTSRDELLYSLQDVSLHSVLPAILLQICPHKSPIFCVKTESKWQTLCQEFPWYIRNLCKFLSYETVGHVKHKKIRNLQVHQVCKKPSNL